MGEFNQNLPGRLGNPDVGLQHDPRADPRIIAAIAAVGGFEGGLAPVAADASYDDCLTYCAAYEDAVGLGNDVMRAHLPIFESVASMTETLTGADGNELTLYIHRPTRSEGPRPCIVHIHGGGMAVMSAADPLFVRWRNSLADLGLLVIGVEFRNSSGRLGSYPFPAGLNDCASAVQWTDARRAELGVSAIVVSGESGGANLALATALKAKREGWVERIDGVYAMCPFIGGAYAPPPARLLSLVENDGYVLSCRQMTAFVKAYDPTGAHATNPLAWPLQAQPADLEGLPPHVISVNELDPLRDEGLAYYRALLQAGVSAVGRTVAGTPHAGDQALPDVTPDVYWDTLRSIDAFARATSSR